MSDDYNDFDLFSLVQHYKLPLQPPGPIGAAYGSIPAPVINSHIQSFAGRRPQQALSANPMPGASPQMNSWYSNYNNATAATSGSVVDSVAVPNNVLPGDPRSGGEIMGQAAQDHINWLNSVNSGGGEKGQFSAEGEPVIYPHQKAAIEDANALGLVGVKDEIEKTILGKK